MCGRVSRQKGEVEWKAEEELSSGCITNSTSAFACTVNKLGLSTSNPACLFFLPASPPPALLYAGTTTPCCNKVVTTEVGIDEGNDEEDDFDGEGF